MLLSQAFLSFAEEYIFMSGLTTKTFKNYRTAMNSFIKAVGDLDITLIMPSHYSRWKLYCEQRGHSNTTINHNMVLLNNVLKFYKRRGVNVVDTSVIDLPKLPAPNPTYLTVDEIDAILNEIESVRDKAIVACLFSTGCRISELLNLNREDIQDNRAQVMGKGSRPGIVYFDDRAKKLLDDYLATRKDRLRPLFISGQRRRITPARVGQLLHEYADYAGIDKNVTAHVFRHSFASDLKFNGADIFEIQQLLRHEKITSTMIYTHVPDKHREEAHKKYHSKPKVSIKSIDKNKHMV